MSAPHNSCVLTNAQLSENYRYFDKQLFSWINMVNSRDIYAGY